MNRKKHILGLCALLATSLHASMRINLFLHDYPLSQERAQKLMHKMSRPEKIAQYEIEAIMENRPSIGIFSTYAGFLNVSDQYGHVFFPKKHVDPTVYFLITPEITPVMMFGSTVHHWTITPGKPAAMFLANREFDEETKLYFWNVQPTDLPENDIIPNEAITLFAKPKHVFIPQGITITDNRENWKLPNIYMKKGLKVLKNSLYALSISNLLRPIDIIYKKDKMRIQNHLIG